MRALPFVKKFFCMMLILSNTLLATGAEDRDLLGSNRRRTSDPYDEKLDSAVPSGEPAIQR